MPAQHFRPTLLVATCTVLAACSSVPPSLVNVPVVAKPPTTPMFLEQPANGAIFQAHMANSALFSGERRPRAIGDTMKVDIAESLRATQKQTGETSRESKLASKGPGGAKPGTALASLINVDATASGSDSFKGSGNAETANSFNAQLAVTVINVLPNGHLLVAGERSIGLAGGVTTLRFSGIVDPHDIGAGNVVASKDVVNANLESVARGDVSEANSRTWLQRVLARTLSIW
ncbi:flagellar basal body L-ring protein FlgH [Roseateles cellulosilyticus]|uniref:Flagellar basal body L-ring protein FlgH n=1 Tax=Pelomonas cellulosilytica TaxID=2906762 RepID=A0ABS8XSN5_9BURK|nr:flagellar basal body L-ring protein FlgH [Pelomonas sp. P8]MCE4554722.1 flagellar basal body L-ring protein FlgH [Pelomonas sp. P8]